MALWGNVDNANNAPKYKGVLAGPKENGAAVRGNTAYNNSTPGVFQAEISHGVYGMDATEVVSANAGVQHAGWATVRVGTGPVISIGVNAVGSSFANGETITIKPSVGSNYVNATATVVTNNTGNLSSFSDISGGAGFVNSTAFTASFNREQHAANVLVTGTTNAFSNSDYIVLSNGTVNAVANISTNSIGGISNSSFTISTLGLFSNAIANADVVVTAYAANGAASNGVGATFSATLGTSTGGSVTGLVTVGGHAGRKFYETLVAMSGVTFDV